MPRFSRKSRRRTGDDADRVERLLSGFYIERCPFGDDEAAMRAEWNELRDSLLAKWIADRPGTRPWGWWAFDAPERRRTVGGRIHPFDCKKRTLHVAKSDHDFFWKRAYALHWGLPACFIPPFDMDLYADFMRHWPDTKLFEPEWSYLARLDLLTEEDSP
jgi:hypothetical protein